MVGDKSPEKLRKGLEFERIVGDMFPRSHFEILFQTDDRGTKVPDFYIRDIRDEGKGYKFWVEAKFRSYLVEDRIDIFGHHPERLVLLRMFQEIVIPETVFLVLGLEGTSSRPYRLYCLPVRDLTQTSPFPSYIEKWSIDRSPFKSYENGLLIQ